ncbi:MAG: sigma-70 family RNA polymerase sigma factor [Ancalomicrobiaceae bacterium]|nr:sigma-70 family RNA polymerase sigma factor [Ancalomicrobiaceae bacterium]
MGRIDTGPSNDEILMFLLAQTARGDESAFTAVYNRTNRALLKFAIRITGRRETAEDVLQEAYEAIWKRAGLYDPLRGLPMTWLMTIVKNTSISMLRRDSRMPMAEDFDLETIPAAHDALTGLIAAETEASLAQAIETLPQRSRDLLVAAYVDGTSRAAIATQIGAPVATVKTWLHRTVNQLKGLAQSSDRRPISPSDPTARRPLGQDKPRCDRLGNRALAGRRRVGS